jgi:glutamate--cysteine ligase
VLKANNSRDGLGIMTVRDIKELDQLQSRMLQRLGGSESSGSETSDSEAGSREIIVQEGVPTMERIHRAVAEPVVYMIDRYVVGGFYRLHAERAADEDLCGPGSSYVPLAFAESTQLPKPGVKPGASAPNRFYMYGVIGRLAMLAAAYELEATDPDAEDFD